MTVDAVIFDWGGTLTRWHDVDFHEEALALAQAVVQTADDLARSLRVPDDGRALLVADVDETALRTLAPSLRDVPHLVGLAQDTGGWILVLSGPVADDVRTPWPMRRNAPFGLRTRPATAPGSSAGAPAELAR